MAIIGLLLLAIVVMAFIMRGAPKPDLEKAPPPKPDHPPIPHPWSSGVKGDIDDFAGPAAPYGPGTSDNDETN